MIEPSCNVKRKEGVVATTKWIWGVAIFGRGARVGGDPCLLELRAACHSSPTVLIERTMLSWGVLRVWRPQGDCLARLLEINTSLSYWTIELCKQINIVADVLCLIANMDVLFAN